PLGGRRVRRPCLAASLGHSGAELGSPAIPHLLPAKARRAVNRPRVPSSSPAAHAVIAQWRVATVLRPAAVGAHIRWSRRTRAHPKASLMRCFAVIREADDL